MLARLLAGSALVAWPTLFAADHLPEDTPLNGKFDDFVTGGIVVLLIVGLVAAGWLRPLWAVLAAVLLLSFVVPMLYEAAISNGVGPMESLSLYVLFAVPGLLLVVIGAVARSAARSPAIPLLPRQE